MPNSNTPANEAEALARIAKNNQTYKNTIAESEFQRAAKGQNPWVMVFNCIDSRLTHESVTGMDGRLGKGFTPSKMANCVWDFRADTEFAINVKGVRFVVIEAHTECGGIQGALGDIGNLPQGMHTELKRIRDTIAAQPDDPQTAHLPETTRAALKNLRAQVELLCSWFPEKVGSGELMVFGMLHDLHNQLGNGHGRNHLYTINGEVEAATLKAHPAMSQVKESLLVQRKEPSAA